MPDRSQTRRLQRRWTEPSPSRSGNVDRSRAIVDRRTFLVGAAVLAAASCGGGNGDGGAQSGTSAGAGSTGELAAARFTPAFTVAADGTPQRSVWGLADQRGPLRFPDVPEQMLVTISQDGATVASPTEVSARSDGIPFPYFPVIASFDAPGVYDISLEWDGGAVQSVLQAFDSTEVPLLAPGDAVPAVVTPTTSDPGSVSPICTRSEVCPFHDTTLADALGDRLPTVLIVSTPGFCQTAVCGPMLELVIEAHGQRDAAFSAVHGEVYRDPSALADGTAVTTEVMDATGMTEAGFEPAVFLIDAAGVVFSRLDNVVDRTELSDELDRLLA